MLPRHNDIAPKRTFCRGSARKALQNVRLVELVDLAALVGTLDHTLGRSGALLVGPPLLGVEVQEDAVEPQTLIEPTPSARAQHLRGLSGEPQWRRNRHVCLGFLQCLDD